jgi:hypothetical protein
VARIGRAAKKYERVEQAVHDWEDYLGLWRDNIAWMSNAYYLSSPWKRLVTRAWLEALGARVIVNPYGSATLATLQLHLTRLDVGKSADTGSLDVPVRAVAPEPRRHGNQRPEWQRVGYVEVAPPTDEQIAQNAAFWAKLDHQLHTAEGVAERHGWTLAEATAYLAERAAMEQEAKALSEAERWEYWLSHTLPRAHDWIQAYRAGGSFVSRLSS